MKLLILLIVVLSCNAAFAQKHKKSKKNVVSFDYSYRLDAAQYKHFIMYGIQLSEYNQDSVLVSCNPDTSGVSGTISYSYNLVSGMVYSTDGKFQIKIPKTNLANSTLDLTLQFDGYDETVIHAQLAEYPDEFFIVIEGNSIFDEETPYIIVNSVYPMTKTELRKLVDCLYLNGAEPQTCYDEKLVKLVIPI